MTTTMTISDLPRDLEEEILTRIPLKNMRSVRLTCKNWDTLSKNRSFMKKHFAKEENFNSQMFVLLMDYKLYLMSVVVNGIDVDPYTEPKGKLTSLRDDSEQQVEISQFFQCEGLLLCILKDTLTLAVWNPYLGQRTRWIKPRYTYRESYGRDMYSYALGYSNKKSKLSLGSYKILRFIDDYFYYGLKFNRDHLLWYEIYDFDTGLWKTLDFTPKNWRIICYSRGVSLKGNTYWIAVPMDSRKRLKDSIICFDFTRERFGRLLPLPRPIDALTTLSSVREEKLAALYLEDGTPMVEIWITTKIEAEEVLWSKFMTINTDTLADIPFVFTYGNFLIDEEKKLAMVFDKEEDDQSNENLRHSINIIGEDGRYYREVDLGEHGYSKLDGRVSRTNYCWTHGFSYVPSLVQIKQRGCKRKRQSSLERHRCEQNTSRLAEIQKRMKQKQKHDALLKKKHEALLKQKHEALLKQKHEALFKPVDYCIIRSTGSAFTVRLAASKI